LLHLWLAERNAVRRVLNAEVKNGMLRLAVQRLGQARPTKLEICRERDRRSPTAKGVARAAYEHKLRRTLERHFPGFAIARLTSGADLEKSFGPIYTRGSLRQGRSAFAVLGVNASETQASVDAPLTFGILWLDVCRQAQAGKVVVQGLRMFVPQGTRRELSAEKPLLFLVAPALHVHPATDILLRYVSPGIEWEFVGIDERWREGVRVVFPSDRSEERGVEANYSLAPRPEWRQGTARLTDISNF
jgi:hypothetical protein